MLRVGLTGGIGSGKSTVAAMFAACGVPVIDADEIARHLAARGQPAYDLIVRAFGAAVLDGAGEIDRAKMRGRVFKSAGDRARLEGIIHPLVRSEIATRLRGLQAAYCVIVIPLLIEARMEDLVDRILLVDCTAARQIDRVRARSGLSEDQIRQIMAAQADPDERRRHADDIIVNDAGLDRLEEEVRRLHERYLGLSGPSAATPQPR